jgi:hypothetical protein
MHTPQHNPDGYDNSSISDVASLAKNVRFLVMHGVADDNVHMQNSLTLLDKLDLAGVENYDVHVFPDSDHSIYFHNANRIVYDSKYHHQCPTSITEANLFCRIEQLAYQCIQRRMAKDRKRSSKSSD